MPCLQWADFHGQALLGAPWVRVWAPPGRAQVGSNEPGLVLLGGGDGHERPYTAGGGA